MFYRFIYIVWRIFWSSILVLLATVILFAGAIFGLLQTTSVQNYITDRVEIWFNENYEGTLHIGEMDGLLPFEIKIRDIKLHYEGHTPVTVEELAIRPDILSIIRENVHIRSLQIREPVIDLSLGDDGRMALLSAFNSLEKELIRDWRTSDRSRHIDLFIPSLQIVDGKLHWPDWLLKNDSEHIPDTLIIERFNTDIFVEVTEEQRFWDITYLTMEVPDILEKDSFTLSGQLYNDSESLELNAMRLRFGNSYADWSSTVFEVDLFSGNILNQILDAEFQFSADQLFIESGDLSFWIPELPLLTPNVTMTLDAYGNKDLLNISRSNILIGETLLTFAAEINDYRRPELLTYELDILSFMAGRQEFLSLVPDFRALTLDDNNVLEANGRLYGNSDSLYTDLRLEHRAGFFDLRGSARIRAPFKADLQIETEQFDVSKLHYAIPDPTTLSARAHILAENVAEPTYRYELSLFFEDAITGNVDIDSLSLELVYENQRIDHLFVLHQKGSVLNGHGLVDVSRDIPRFVVEGSLSDVNLLHVYPARYTPETELTMDFEIDWHGLRAEDWHGRIVADMYRSIVNEQELRPHQFYLDLNTPESRIRSLRFTSSVLDLLIEGEVPVSNVMDHYEHWGAFFTHRVGKELLFEDMSGPVEYVDRMDGILDVDLILEVKDPGLLKAYFPLLPAVESNAHLALHITSNSDELMLKALLEDAHTGFRDFRLGNSTIHLDAAFNYNQLLRKQVSFDLEIDVDHFLLDDYQIDDIRWKLSLLNDSLKTATRIGQFGYDILLSVQTEAILGEKSIEATITEFMVGNDRYMWQNPGIAALKYTEEGQLEIRDFILQSNGDKLSLDGVLSTRPDDDLEIIIDNVDLNRISQMIDGKIDFEGELNAGFIVQNILNAPVFYGEMRANRLAFNERLIGDVDITSRFNPERNRFDTNLRVFTDSLRYASYRYQNQGRGNNLTALGWMKIPETEHPEDPFLHFDVDLQEVDLWVLEYILDGVFESIEGTGEGHGHLSLNRNRLDFYGDFQVVEAVVEPVFFETEYELSGPISLGRDEGVLIHRVDVRDRDGGTGLLTGHYDFNDFQAQKFMDMTLSLNNLIFLNNSDGPEVPFYGTVAGTGVINISGSNISPFVRTIDPVTTSSRSRLSIPLADQMSSNDYGRFIHFVSDFQDIDLRKRIRESPEVIRQVDRSFMEVFRLDLQFVAASNSTVQLIFDPVTGEIVNARGSGRVRIMLEDETLQIFGNYDISDGDYLFVGGDIITRRFTLREGGSIRWDGDPVNAMLDITAVYRARPNIAPLVGAGMEQTNRIPVELLLEITGPINNLANDFYFDFPNAIDASQNAAVLNVLNSEEQKLIQATSLLFTGGFLSGAMVGDTQTQELGSTLQARAGQVGISQLLSSQINTLLSSNQINLDVDLNLYGFDQADLGIALRLFDDRLVLRREGEVGGEEANIGDLGATYRINPNLSVEVFHRKDPMLLSILGTQAEVENVNGVGLEAQFRFNSFKDFGNRIWRNLTTMFGLISRSEDEEPNMDQEGE